MPVIYCFSFLNVLFCVLFLIPDLVNISALSVGLILTVINREF